MLLHTAESEDHESLNEVQEKPLSKVIVITRVIIGVLALALTVVTLTPIVTGWFS